MSVVPILCVTGQSGRGKTTLLERLIGQLSAAGLAIGAIKHAAGGLDLHRPGKDSSRLTEAGARPVIAAGPNGTIIENPPAEAPLAELAYGFCAGCDLVLAEGYRHSPHDKLVVDSKGIRSQPGEQRFDRDDVAAVTQWVRSWLDRRRRLGEGIVGTILAGGQSRRMGADKSTMRIGGQPVLARLAELLADRTEQVWIVGRAGGQADLGRWARWHLDIRGGAGPLGGVATALHLAEAEGYAGVLAVACDMPLLGGEVLELLLERRDPARAATAFRNSATGRIEPLATIYELHSLEQIEQTLEAGSLSATAFLASAGAAVINLPAELASQLANVNTPDDLAQLDR